VESIDIWGFDNGQRFVCYAGIGIDAEIISFIDRHRGAMPGWKEARRFMLRLLYGAAAARYAACRIIKRKRKQGNIDFYIKGDFVKSVNCARTEAIIITSLDRYAGGGHLSEKACRNDGIFEVYRFAGLSSYIRFLVKSRVGGRFMPEPEFSADRAVFSADSTMNLQMDGEPYTISPFPGTCAISLQRAIPVLIPPHDLAARERIRRKIPGQQEVKAEVSPIMPGAASGSRSSQCLSIPTDTDFRKQVIKPIDYDTDKNQI
jgi:diacylglycerol kinase family enzyme